MTQTTIHLGVIPLITEIITLFPMMVTMIGLVKKLKAMAFGR